MNQTLTLTPSTDPLGLNPVWRGSPFIFSGATQSGITLYKAQIWRKPQDATNTSKDPLATAYASVSTNTVAFAFTPDQMDFTLLANNGAEDDLWLSVAGLNEDGHIEPLRTGWFRVIEPGHRGSDFTDITATFSITNDYLMVVFVGEAYRTQVVEVGAPGGASAGEYVVVNDNAIFTDANGSFSLQVSATATPSGLVEGGILVLGDVMYLMFDGQAYKAPVQQIS